MEELTRRKRRRTNHRGLLNSDTKSLVRPLSTDDGDAPTNTTVKLTKKAITELITYYNLPYTILKSPQFRQLQYLWNAKLIGQLLPKSDTVMMRWLIEAFKENLSALKEQLYHKKISKIRLSADFWKSPNQKTLLTVVAHFVYRQISFRTRLAAVRVIGGRNTGGFPAQRCTYRGLCLETWSLKPSFMVPITRILM